MNPFWIGVLGTSSLVFALKYFGHIASGSWLEHPKIKQINTLVPIAMLSALVGLQSFTNNSQILINHRIIGISVAIIALILKAPFPLVVLSAAISSAFVYNHF